MSRRCYDDGPDLWGLVFGCRLRHYYAPAGPNCILSSFAIVAILSAWESVPSIVQILDILLFCDNSLESRFSCALSALQQLAAHTAQVFEVQ